MRAGFPSLGSMAEPAVEEITGATKWRKPAEWDSLLLGRAFLRHKGIFLKPTAPGEAYWYAINPQKELTFPTPADADPRSDPEPQKVKRFANCPPGLRPFIPDYFGIKLVAGSEYIAMRDLMHGMRNPCLLDIKLGTREFDPFANAKKVDGTTGRFAMRDTFGFRVVGLQMWKKTGEGSAAKFEKVKNDKAWGSGLVDWKKDIIGDCATRFISLMSDVQKARFVVCLEKLDDAWTRIGAKEILIFSSSVLFIYEGAGGLGNLPPEGAEAAGFDKDKMEGKLIDLNHSFYRKHHPKVEDGVLQGIRNCRRAFLTALTGSPGHLGDGPVVGEVE